MSHMGRCSASKASKAKGRGKCDRNGCARSVLHLFPQEVGIVRACWLPRLRVCRVLVTDGRYDKNCMKLKTWWWWRIGALARLRLIESRFQIRHCGTLSDRSVEADSHYCPCHCGSVKVFRCIATGSVRHVHDRHDVSALAWTSGRTRVPGFTMWRRRIQFWPPCLWFVRCRFLSLIKLCISLQWFGICNMKEITVWISIIFLLTSTSN